MELLLSLLILMLVFSFLLLGPAWLVFKKNEKLAIEKKRKPIEHFRCGYTFYESCSKESPKCCANVDLSWPFTRVTLYDDFLVIKNIAKTVFLKYKQIKNVKSQFQFSVIIDTDNLNCPERISLTTYKNTQKLMDLINTKIS